MAIGSSIASFITAPLRAVRQAGNAIRHNIRSANHRRNTEAWVLHSVRHRTTGASTPLSAERISLSTPIPTTPLTSPTIHSLYALQTAKADLTALCDYMSKQNGQHHWEDQRNYNKSFLAEGKLREIANTIQTIENSTPVDSITHQQACALLDNGETTGVKLRDIAGTSKVKKSKILKALYKQNYFKTLRYDRITELVTEARSLIRTMNTEGLSRIDQTKLRLNHSAEETEV